MSSDTTGGFMSWLIGQSSGLGEVAAKAVLMYVTALVAIHRLASLLRFNALLGKLVDHRVRVLVVDAELRTRELRRCGLTDNDLFTQLRQRGVFSLSDVRYVLYESKGSITAVLRDVRGDPELIRAGLSDAAGYP